MYLLIVYVIDELIRHFFVFLARLFSHYSRFHTHLLFSKLFRNNRRIPTLELLPSVSPTHQIRYSRRVKNSLGRPASTATRTLMKRSILTGKSPHRTHHCTHHCTQVVARHSGHLVSWIRWLPFVYSLHVHYTLFRKMLAVCSIVQLLLLFEGM